MRIEDHQRAEFRIFKQCKLEETNYLIIHPLKKQEWQKYYKNYGREEDKELRYRRNRE
jgi:hypothetical protein